MKRNINKAGKSRRQKSLKENGFDNEDTKVIIVDGKPFHTAKWGKGK